MSYRIRLKLKCGGGALVMCEEAFPVGSPMSSNPDTAGCRKEPVSCKFAEAYWELHGPPYGGPPAGYMCPGEVVSVEEDVS